MVPQRDEITKDLIATFRAEMALQSTPMVCVEESIVPGEDDWGAAGDEEDDETSRVGFWWGIYRRAEV